MLQDAGVEPDVWKIEGLVLRQDCEKVVEVTRRDGRAEVSCIVLGRGSDEKRVLRWLRTAAGVPGFIGFAVGRTTWWDAMTARRENKISRDEAITQISTRFHEWVNVFEKLPTADR
jgi:myo-inositol catabolism protein IolC